MLFKVPSLLFAFGIFPCFAWAQVKIESGCVLASLPGSNSSVVLVTIHNHGAEVVQFTHVTSDKAGKAEFHDMRMQDGVMYMQRINNLQVAAKRKLRLGLEGIHLMLLELTNPLQPEQQAIVTLYTDKGEALKVRLPVVAREHKHQCDKPLSEVTSLANKLGGKSAHQHEVDL